MPASSTQPQGNVVAKRRSMKAMQACLEGIPMVSIEWIEACRRADAVVIPEPSMYVRSLPTKSNSSSNADFGAAKLAAARHFADGDSERYIPFRNKLIYLCGFSCKNESIFSALAREAGAKEVITKPLTALAKLKAINPRQNENYGFN